jgi:hypothetical protein
LKKSSKNLLAYLERGGETARRLAQQEFFGSFLQKRTSALPGFPILAFRRGAVC